MRGSRKSKTETPRVTVLFLLAKFNTRFKQATTHFKETSKESGVTLVVIYNRHLPLLLHCDQTIPMIILTCYVYYRFTIVI